MNRIMRTAAIALGVLVGTLTLTAAPALAVGTTIVHVVDSPDDGTPPWARDTFTRTTSFAPIEGGFSVTIWDNGSFKTEDGVVGKLDGTGTWKITGGTAKTPSLPGTINRSSVAVKDSFTGNWWKNFVEGGEVKSFTWEWKYKSECWKASYRQTRTESSANGVSGAYPSKVCPPKPTPSASVSSSASASPSASASASASTSTSASASASGSVRPSSSSPAGAGGFTTMPNSGGGDSLPVTGPSMGLLISFGIAVIGTGAVLTMLFRRRKLKFAA